MSRLTYAAITPARDETDNLRRLAQCLLAQNVRPEAWVIVDSGSRESSMSTLLTNLESEIPWVRVAEAPGSETPLPGGPVVRAFHEGLRALDAPVDVIVKLDADVSFDDTYFEGLIGAFAVDPELGIAGGVCLEMEAGEWVEMRVAGDHVRGATRAYRTECLEQLLPLPERMGWDTVDEMKARMLGWRANTIPGLTFRHHRRLGARDGSRTARWTAQGRASWYIGYRPTFILARSAHRFIRHPAAVAMLVGYVGSALRREPRHPDDELRRYVRSHQGVRGLSARMLEAVSRRRR